MNACSGWVGGWLSYLFEMRAEEDEGLGALAAGGFGDGMVPEDFFGRFAGGFLNVLCGWVGGWVEEDEEDDAVRMSYCEIEFGLGGWRRRRRLE